MRTDGLNINVIVGSIDSAAAAVGIGGGFILAIIPTSTTRPRSNGHVKEHLTNRHEGDERSHHRCERREENSVRAALSKLLLGYLNRH